jgi:hypothetical protein
VDLAELPRLEVVRPTPLKAPPARPDPSLCGFLGLQPARLSSQNDDLRASTSGSTLDAFQEAITEIAQKAVLPSLLLSTTYEASGSKLEELTAKAISLPRFSPVKSGAKRSPASTLEALAFRIEPMLGAPAMKTPNPLLSSAIRLTLPAAPVPPPSVAAADPMQSAVLWKASASILPTLPYMAAQSGVAARPLPLEPVLVAASPGEMVAKCPATVFEAMPWVDAEPALGKFSRLQLELEEKTTVLAGRLPLDLIASTSATPAADPRLVETFEIPALRFPQLAKIGGGEQRLPESMGSVRVTCEMVRRSTDFVLRPGNPKAAAEFSLISIQPMGVNDPDGCNEPRGNALVSTNPAIPLPVGEIIEMKAPRLIRILQGRGASGARKLDRTTGIFIPKLRIGTYRPRMAFGPVPKAPAQSPMGHRTTTKHYEHFFDPMGLDQ